MGIDGQEYEYVKDEDYSNKYGNSFYTNPAVKGFLTNVYGSDWVSTQTKPKKVVDQNTGEVLTVDKETGQEVKGNKERAADLTIDEEAFFRASSISLIL